MPPNEDGSVQQPVNREPDTANLTKSFLTPCDGNAKSSNKDSQSEPVAYERNHGPIRHLDADSHKLTIKSNVCASFKSTGFPTRINIVLTIDELSSKFRPASITAALQCAGNRRHEMRERVDDVQGIDWGGGAVINAKWGGVLLRDVLLEAGLKPDDALGYEGLHVHFSSSQPTQDDSYYGASIPLSVAMDPDRSCLLALSMNGETLTAKHGYPLRVIVPGIIGARSVKWLEEITISSHESTNHYQKRDYKVLTGEVVERIEAAETKEEKGQIMEEVEAMGDNPVNSVVAVPAKDGDVLHRDEQGKVYVRGYAIPKGKDGPVVKVEVSINRGRSWLDADIIDGGDKNTTQATNKGSGEGRGKFAWVLWECHFPVGGDEPKEDVSIWSKATDQGGNTMDVEYPEGNWNLRGVGYNAVEGRRRIKIV